MLCRGCCQRLLRFISANPTVREAPFRRGPIRTFQLNRWYCGQDAGRESYKKENIVTIPNFLSLSRIAASPALGYLILHERYSLALGLFALSGISDVLDGYIARNFKGQSSMLGSILDPLADKVLMSILCVSLTYMGLFPVPLTAVILGRDVLLVASSFYLRYITLPPPRNWSRYWDIQRSTVEVTPNLLGKVNTALQLLSVGLCLTSAVVDMADHPLLFALWYITAATTVSSGVSYLYKMKGFRVLNKPP